MGMNIEDDDAVELAHELARLRGVSLDEADKDALKEQLRRARLTAAAQTRPPAARLNDIALRCAALPDLERFPLAWNRLRPAPPPGHP